MTFPEGRMERVIERMVRGLYFHSRGELFPAAQA